MALPCFKFGKMHILVFLPIYENGFMNNSALNMYLKGFCFQDKQIYNLYSCGKKYKFHIQDYINDMTYIDYVTINTFDYLQIQYIV